MRRLALALAAVGVLAFGLAGCGGSRHGKKHVRLICSGSELCVSLPNTSTTFAGGELSTQDVYTYGSTQNPPSGGSPTVWQRLQNLDSRGWRQVGYPQYNDTYTTMISPINYYVNAGGIQPHLAWNFKSADRELSLAPPTATRDFDEQWPAPLFYCPSGSWTDPSTGCTERGAAAFADQSYTAMAKLFAGIVKYFRTAMIASDSGSRVTYTADSVTDTSGALSRTAGDCITATVLDRYGSPDWLTGTVSSVVGNTATLTGNWSTSESWDTEAGNGAITSSTPASGAAYNVASCTPPGDLAGGKGAAAAQPWPRPPSAGNVQNYELGNEPDDGGSGVPFSVPSLPAPTPTLTGVNVGDGTLTPGTTYHYEVASAGAEGSGTQLYGGGGGLSRPGTEQSIRSRVAITQSRSRGTTRRTSGSRRTRTSSMAARPGASSDSRRSGGTRSLPTPLRSLGRTPGRSPRPDLRTERTSPAAGGLSRLAATSRCGTWSPPR